MKNKLLFLFLISISSICFGGNIYIVENGNADIKVWIANNKSEADICVYVANNKQDAKDKDQIWYFEKNKNMANIKIKLVDKKNSADLKVLYVKNKSDVCWKNKSHRLTGRLK